MGADWTFPVAAFRRGANQDPVGAGVLVSGDFVLTCAHVVEAALKGKSKRFKRGRGPRRPSFIERLYLATLETMTEWISRLRKEAGLGSPRGENPRSKFPEKVTAFRAEMAVHGRYGKPCPRCGGKVPTGRRGR